MPSRHIPVSKIWISFFSRPTIKPFFSLPISTPMVGGGGGSTPPHPLQYHWSFEGVGPETHVHKITNIPVFYMALGLNDYDAGKFISPLLRPLDGMGPHNGYCLHQKHYVPRKINIMT